MAPPSEKIMSMEMFTLQLIEGTRGISDGLQQQEMPIYFTAKNKNGKVC